MYKLGFIGCGNMGKAMIGGIINSGQLSATEIIVSDLNEAALKAANAELGIHTTTDSLALAKDSEIIVVAVKPNIYGIVLEQIKSVISDKTIIVTIAAGISINFVEQILGDDKKIIRTMPNTPALVGEGMTAMCPNKNISKEEQAHVLSLLSGFGKAEIVGEYLIDSVIGVSGSSPAYVFMFIEAMADAAVLAGMPRAQAYTFAAQAVYGSAKMVMETGKHPGELKDMVCSPGGTTIEAVKMFEKTGFRSAVIESIGACIEKSKAMSK
ncbi:MAG: pyrroline-5-carboxylate reductase [Clostridia bacterium]|nr:pyrroline-5-carboxylate reductase [Clostridia bacterium]